MTAEHSAEFRRRQATGRFERPAEVALIRKTRCDRNFGDWICARRELARRDFDSAVASVLPYTAAVPLAKNTSEVYRMDPNSIGNVLHRDVVREGLM